MRPRLASTFLVICLAAASFVFQGFTFAPPIADPIADPGGAYTTRRGEPVILDGSEDDDLPQAEITAPSENTTIEPGQSLSFQGNADGENLQTIDWTFQNGDPATASGEGSHSVTWTQPGDHTVQFTVCNDEGCVSDFLTVIVEAPPPPNQSPSASITSPGAGATFTQGQPIPFEGSGTDPEDGPLNGGNLVWSSDRDGQIGTGGTFIRNDLSVGSHTITLTATDSQGAPGSASVDITVQQAPPPNQNPNASDDAASTRRNRPVEIDVLVNDSDPDGDVLSVLDFTQGANGSVSRGPGNNLTYTPNPPFTGSDQFSYTASDGRGGTDGANVTVNVTPNQPPNAVIDSPAGNLTIQAGQSVNFQGTATDPDGTIVGYSWNIPGGSPSSSTAEDPGTVTFPGTGVFVVTFNATDDSGASDASPGTRTITVTPATGTNQPPSAVIVQPAGNVTIQAGQSVSFQGSGTDSDGTIVAYSWSFPGGSPSGSTAEDPGNVTFPGTGVFVVTFNVTDDDGASDPTPATRTITVTPAGGTNQPPNAVIEQPAGNVTIQAGQSVNFQGSGTDSDGTIVAYSWSFPGGAPASSTAEDPGSVTFPGTGVFVVTFNVTDDDGASDPSPATRTITVTPASGTNQPPNATIDLPAGNVTIQAGRTVQFGGTGADPDGSVVAFSWSFPGGTPASSTAEDPGSVAFLAPGVYNVVFNVTDNGGASDPSPATRTVTVTSAPGQNQPPNTDIEQPSSNVTIQAGQTVSFQGRATDTDGQVVAFDWSFGGGVGNGAVEDPGNVRFNSPGVYTVTFNATDDDGASDPTPARRTVTVTQQAPNNQAPSAMIDEPAGGVTIQAGQSVTFRGTGRDPDGTVVAHLWSFGGGAPSSNVEDPGAVTFSTPNSYTVTYNVTDDGGASDPTPSSVTVVVEGTGGGGGNVADFNVEAGMPGSADRVDGHDVMFVLRAILTQDPRADVNQDGVVNELDVQLTLAALGEVQ